MLDNEHLDRLDAGNQMKAQLIQKGLLKSTSAGFDSFTRPLQIHIIKAHQTRFIHNRLMLLKFNRVTQTTVQWLATKSEKLIPGKRVRGLGA